MLRRAGMVTLTGGLIGLAMARMLDTGRGVNVERLKEEYGSPLPDWMFVAAVAAPVVVGLVGVGVAAVFQRWARPWLRVRTPAWAEGSWCDDPPPRTGVLRVMPWSDPAAALVLVLTLEFHWAAAAFMVGWSAPVLIELWRTKPWKEAV